MRVFLYLMWFFKQEKKAYVTGILLLLLVAFLQLVPPRLIGVVVDAINNETLTSADLIKWMTLLLSSAVGMYVLRYIWRVMIFGSAVKLGRQLRERLYKHFTQMAPQFYQNRRVGDLMAHATNDLSAVQQTAGAGVLTLVDSLATGLFVIAAMAITIDVKLTLIALIPMPFMAILTNYYGTLLHKRFGVAQEAFSDLNDKTQESISGVKVLKTFGQEKEDIESFSSLSKEVVDKNIAVARVDSLFDPTIALVVGASFFLSIFYGGQMVVADELTIGQLISFTTYLGLLIWPMLAFGWLFNIVERGRASYERVEALLNQDIDIKDKPNAIAAPPKGEILVEIDDFTFPGSSTPSLKEVHFTLNRGETLGIVGRTGAGKTTILKLLMREFEGYEGKIMIDSISIDEYSKSALRSSIGYVPQDHFLFSASIKENIAFTNPALSQSEINRAASLAHVHEDILGFSSGYDTVVGERGVSLSGGQKQRISIARALIMNPEILLLDDSLSAVDAKTEEAILSSLKETRNGKTTIITSHRLSAVQHADLIIVLDEGMLVESGSHEVLMKQKGWYYAMYMRQQLEDLVEQGGHAE
ncbi:ABC transporter transmembrane domain-containing protein [Jeotgalibacillus proteolyticus]|uniref:Multidrug ABC transporter permease/ATP-binding protein n=1 Tax=Jeotgalibacillus proteolyticus TaxID=2082395 RepID=A0A2S5GGB2_9BACL|nr:ABC transporter transmembrane domain-containing protein [Jeotgalibacillus proteolyticus]PPA71961.1 multidrug ABC transporter permease/ATP-binding protein [Jeotgalibacillus proteolyticus]